MTIESLIGAAAASGLAPPTGCSTIAGLRAGPSVQHNPPDASSGRDMVTEERRFSTSQAASDRLLTRTAAFVARVFNPCKMRKTKAPVYSAPSARVEHPCHN